MFVKRFAGEKISTGIGKVEGPDQGWEESGPSGSDLGGRDRNTTNATAPSRTARAQNVVSSTTTESGRRGRRSRRPPCRVTASVQNR